MGMFKDNHGALRKLRLLAFGAKSDVDTFREKIEDSYSCVFLPNHVDNMVCDYGGVQCDVLVPEIYSSKRVLLYIHGGSFVGGSRDSWRSFCASLANVSSCRVIVPEFRLPPIHKYPAALEDVLRVYKALYADLRSEFALEDEDESFDSEIIIAADGSGASIASGMLLSLDNVFHVGIKELLLFSPWLDVSPTSRAVNAKPFVDDVLGPNSVKRSVDVYATEEETKSPLVSIMKADDEMLKKFPNVYIQMGGKEALLADAEEFSQRLKSLNKECILDVWNGMPYMFQMADEFLPESHLAIERIGHHYTARKSDE